ncbi:hypothetical protein SANTM175S_10603 [Streptomyces antimycoticus]
MIAGHVAGLLIPETLTERLRVSESLYHANALILGGTAGLAAVAGLGVLLHRRLRVPAVRAATSRTDKAVYPLLAAVLLAGLTATATGAGPHSYDYRQGVSVWFRSLFALDPDVPAMADAPLAYRLHALLAMALFALWPFSRLVHAFTAPLGYLTRPYVVYRSRTPRRPHPHPALTGAGEPAPSAEGAAALRRRRAAARWRVSSPPRARVPSDRSHIETVMVAGRERVHSGRPVIDSAELLNDARRTAHRLDRAGISARSGRGHTGGYGSRNS